MALRAGRGRARAAPVLGSRIERRRSREAARGGRAEPPAGRQDALLVRARVRSVQQPSDLRPPRFGARHHPAASRARRRGDPRCRPHQRGDRLHPGRPSGKVARGHSRDADPRVLGPARRAATDRSRRKPRRRRRRADRSRRPHSRRPEAPARHEPQDRGGRADGRSGRVRQVGRSRRSRRRARRPRLDGLFRHAGRERTRRGARGRDRRLDRAWAHQRHGRRRRNADHAAHTSDERLRQASDDRHSGARRLRLRLRLHGARLRNRACVHGRGRRRRIGDSRRPARGDDDHARHRRQADGGSQRHHSQPSRGRDAGSRVDHLFGQDRHAHLEPDDGRRGSDRIGRVRDDRNRLRTARRIPSRRRGDRPRRLSRLWRRSPARLSFATTPR